MYGFQDFFFSWLVNINFNSLQGLKLRQHILSTGEVDGSGTNGLELLCADGRTSGKVAGYTGDWDEGWTECPEGEHVVKLAVRGTTDQGMFLISSVFQFMGHAAKLS